MMDVVIKIKGFWRVLIVMLSLNACVEPFEAESISFESALVVEATITNEIKVQQISLSRSYALGEEAPSKEQNASVLIRDDQGTEFRFTESSPGLYSSEQPFAAQPGRIYFLEITTSNGRIYVSENNTLPPLARMDEVYAERITNDAGEEGVAIRVNASGISGDAKNYRYTFEETYKIIAPKWTPQDLRGDPEGGCGMILIFRESEEQTCYATDPSRQIILTNTNDFGEDRVSRFIARFIKRTNYIISHRYSILLRQYVQSDAAYTYFETLKEFSGSESLFSETQPGYLEGNVFSATDRQEKVLGYFDVASATEHRLYFNYADLFPGEPLPPYANPCNENAPPLASPAGCVLRPIVENNFVRYVGSNEPAPLGEGPYRVVPRVCGDCTVLGGTVPPEFWTEE